MYQEVRCSCPALWVFVFTCELYLPCRETCAVRHSAEAWGFILEQIIFLCMVIYILEPSKCSWNNMPQGYSRGRWKLERACGGVDVIAGVLGRELPAVTTLNMVSPGGNKQSGKCWEHTVTQLRLHLSPGEKEPQIKTPFWRQLARKKMCLFLACFENANERKVVSGPLLYKQMLLLFLN